MKTPTEILNDFEKSDQEISAELRHAIYESLDYHRTVRLEALDAAFLIFIKKHAKNKINLSALIGVPQERIETCQRWVDEGEAALHNALGCG